MIQREAPVKPVQVGINAVVAAEILASKEP